MIIVWVNIDRNGPLLLWAVYVRAGLVRAGFGEGGLWWENMAAQADEVFSDVISMDIFGENLLNSETILYESVSNEDKEDILKLVGEIESATSREVIDFTSQETPTLPQRHKSLTDADLDKLAAKNNAEATVYQTKWAITVFKGKNLHSKPPIIEKLHETWLGCFPSAATMLNTVDGENAFSVGVQFESCRSRSHTSLVPKES